MAGSDNVIDDAESLGGLYNRLRQGHGGQAVLISAPVDQVLVLAGDRPFLTARFLERLFERGVQGNAVAPRLKARIDRRLLRVTEALDDRLVSEVGPEEGAQFDPDGVRLMNVDTPDDYERACRHAGARETTAHECDHEPIAPPVASQRRHGRVCPALCGHA